MSDLNEEKTDPYKVRKEVNVILKFMDKSEYKKCIDARMEYILIEEFEDFAEKYPMLLKKIAKRENLNELDKMLKAIELINKNEVSKQHMDMQIPLNLAEKYDKNQYDTMNKILRDNITK
jgi:hypothetical protein